MKTWHGRTKFLINSIPWLYVCRVCFRTRKVSCCFSLSTHFHLRKRFFNKQLRRSARNKALIWVICWIYCSIKLWSVTVFGALIIFFQTVSTIVFGLMLWENCDINIEIDFCFYAQIKWNSHKIRYEFWDMYGDV